MLLEGAIYHVTSMVNYGNFHLGEARFKCMFLEIVKEAKKKFDFELWNFCVMDNHIHFLIKPGSGVSLSKIMQWIKCNFAKRWNKEHGLKGHFWGGRFYSRIVENSEDFEAVSKYIDENPVKANMVKEPGEWQWGGFFHRLKGNKGIITELLNPENLFPVFKMPRAVEVGSNTS
jgi:REP element-mobilizing transposase RayT